MRTLAAAALALLLAVVLLPVSGCTSLLGDFASGPGPKDGGSGDATMEGEGGDAQTTDSPTSGDSGDAGNCGPSNCASGCCDSSGHCIPYATQSGTACGTGGAACASCGASESCSNGACSCGGMACNGCCSSAKTCVTPTSNTACGANGAACQTCASDQECNAQGQCVCDSNSCKNGCCDSSGHCVTSGGATACGTGGAKCAPCPSGQTCSAGKCACNATSCPQGCCTTSGSCEAYSAQSSLSCGNGGAACGQCANGQSCSSGACSCGGGVCAGCCDSSGNCSTSPNGPCGLNGTMCQTCLSGQECNSQGACACDANSCPNGCCDANGHCQTAGPNTCGIGGAACATCGMDQECDTTTGQCVCDVNTCASGCCTSTVGGSCTAYASESVAQCGSAGAVCSACFQPDNATTTCSAGVCSFTCNATYLKCGSACVDSANDPANCGSCGHSCLGGQCSNSACLPYVLAQSPVTSTPMYIASDGTSLVWLDSGRSGAFQIPIQGGTVTTLQSGVTLLSPGAIAVANGTYAFTQTINGPNFHVWTGNLGVTNGGTQGTTWNPGSPYGLSMTPDGAYFGFVEVLSGATGGYVYATSGGTPVDSPVCSGAGCPMKAGQQVAATSTYFAWTINVLTGVNNGEVGLYDYATQTTTFPSKTVLYPDFPVLDSSYLYWVDNASLQIWRMPLPSGTNQLVMDNGSNSFTGLAEDGTYAYFTTNGGANAGVYYVPVSGTGTPVPLRQGGTPQQIIAAGGGIFWIDTSTNDIMGMRFP